MKARLLSLAILGALIGCSNQPTGTTESRAGGLTEATDCGEDLALCLMGDDGDAEACEARLEECFPEEPEDVWCEASFHACLEEGGDPEECGPVVEECEMDAPPPTDEGELCIVMFEDCLEHAEDGFECEPILEGCLDEPEPREPDPAGWCFAEYDECLTYADEEPELCEYILGECLVYEEPPEPVEPCIEEYELCMEHSPEGDECEHILDACFDPPPTEHPCPPDPAEHCFVEFDACVDSCGADRPDGFDDCHIRLDECLASVDPGEPTDPTPVDPEPSDRCFVELDECMASRGPGDDGDGEGIDECHALFDECIDSGDDAEPPPGEPWPEDEGDDAGYAEPGEPEER